MDSNKNRFDLYPLFVLIAIFWAGFWVGRWTAPKEDFSQKLYYSSKPYEKAKEGCDNIQGKLGIIGDGEGNALYICQFEKQPL